MPLSEADRIFIDEVRALYRPLLVGPGSRIERGQVLWGQFEDTAQGYAAGTVPERNLVEKVNELAVARELALDRHLAGPIVYEPDFLPSERRIDFIAERGEDLLFVEVKTVRPQAGDEQMNRRSYEKRKKLHPANVHFIVGGDIGGTIYTDSFKSRSHFLEYALEFEDRLREARVNRKGPAVLVFCGTGFHWSVDELEDFADHYHSGKPRPDDPFGPMEAHHIVSEGIKIARSIDHFAFLRRSAYVAKRSKFHFPVRGPWFLHPDMGESRRVPPKLFKK